MARIMVCVLAAATLLAAVPAYAQYRVQHSQFGVGGGTQTGEELEVSDTVGQALIGITADTSRIAEIGFWYCVWLSSTIGVEVPEVPKATYLSQCYPNPFNPTTTIEFGLKESTKVSLRIYDAAGRVVDVLVDGTRPAGSYRETWDGRDTRGVVIASGVYFFRLEASDFVATRKMVLLR